MQIMSEFGNGLIDLGADRDPQRTFRRRRLAVLAGACTLGLATVVAAAHGIPALVEGVTDQLGGGDCSDQTTRYSVFEGETLYDVARDIPGDPDQRVGVDALMAANGFDQTPATLPATISGPESC